MSELISEKEAFNAWIDGIAVEIFDESDCWHPLHRDHGLCVFDSGDRVKFRLKPRTITMNGIEVPAPFEPKEGDKYYHISIKTVLGYGWDKWEGSAYDVRASMFGAWRAEEEIKQIVAALRCVFGAKEPVRRMSSDSE